MVFASALNTLRLCDSSLEPLSSATTYQNKAEPNMVPGPYHVIQFQTVWTVLSNAATIVIYHTTSYWWNAQRGCRLWPHFARVTRVVKNETKIKVDTSDLISSRTANVSSLLKVFVIPRKITVLVPIRGKELCLYKSQKKFLCWRPWLTTSV